MRFSCPIVYFAGIVFVEMTFYQFVIFKNICMTINSLFSINSYKCCFIKVIITVFNIMPSRFKAIIHNIIYLASNCDQTCSYNGFTTITNKFTIYNFVIMASFWNCCAPVNYRTTTTDCATYTSFFTTTGTTYTEYTVFITSFCTSWCFALRLAFCMKMPAYFSILFCLCNQVSVLIHFCVNYIFFRRECIFCTICKYHFTTNYGNKQRNSKLSIT